MDISKSDMTTLNGHLQSLNNNIEGFDSAILKLTAALLVLAEKQSGGGDTMNQFGSILRSIAPNRLR